jgi:hypothetical protein
MDLQSFLGRTALGSFAFAEQVLTRAQAQLEADGTIAPSQSLEEVLTTALGNRLARALAQDMSANAEASFLAPHGPSPGDYEELIERDSRMTAALGACVCWGERTDCPVCSGAGSPGWVRPDDDMYEVNVRPAVAALERSPWTH